MNMTVLNVAYYFFSIVWGVSLFIDAFFEGGTIFTPYKGLIMTLSILALAVVCSKMDPTKIEKSRGRKSFYFIGHLKETKYIIAIALAANVYAYLIQPFRASIMPPVLLLDAGVLLYFFIRPFKYAYLS